MALERKAISGDVYLPFLMRSKICLNVRFLRSIVPVLLCLHTGRSRRVIPWDVKNCFILSRVNSLSFDNGYGAPCLWRHIVSSYQIIEIVDRSDDIADSEYPVLVSTMLIIQYFVDRISAIISCACIWSLNDLQMRSRESFWAEIGDPDWAQISKMLWTWRHISWAVWLTCPACLIIFIRSCNDARR